MRSITYGVRELQANLSEALRAAERGDRVVVTSRGRPVAVLAKADRERPRGSPVEQKLARLAASGEIVLGTGGAVREFPSLRLGGLSMALEEERGRLERPPARRRPGPPRKRP